MSVLSVDGDELAGLTPNIDVEDVNNLRFIEPSLHDNDILDEAYKRLSEHDVNSHTIYCKAVFDVVGHSYLLGARKVAHYHVPRQVSVTIGGLPISAPILDTGADVSVFHLEPGAYTRGNTDGNWATKYKFSITATRNGDLFLLIMSKIDKSDGEFIPLEISHQYLAKFTIDIGFAHFYLDNYVLKEIWKFRHDRELLEQAIDTCMTLEYDLRAPGHGIPSTKMYADRPSIIGNDILSGSGFRYFAGSSTVMISWLYSGTIGRINEIILQHLHNVIIAISLSDESHERYVTSHSEKSGSGINQ
jgi:hypothetical protein